MRPFPPVRPTCKVALHKSPQAPPHGLSGAGGFTTDVLCCEELAVGAHLAQKVVCGIVRVVTDGMAKYLDRQVLSLYPFVHLVRAKGRHPSVEESLMTTGIPAARSDQPAIEVVVKRNDIDGLRARGQTADFGGEVCGDDFIAVDEQDPVIAGQSDRPAMRLPEAGERAAQLVHADVRVPAGDLDRVGGRSSIEDDDFVTPFQCLETSGNRRELSFVRIVALIFASLLLSRRGGTADCEDR